ncbi:fatty acid desaturase [Myxosarcina sp. GI1]|uniref:fatty acid desaturase family protein n=1 Tax=Myxosarcina sp. GI1 TaxID=1541065 RepID=UPI00056A3D90|nr:fatty acid desaturase [Myxosarcina sp. GI1]
METNTLTTKFNLALLNSLLITYVGVVYLLGVALLFPQNWLLNAIGVILTIHSLVLSAYLIHELLHDNIFKQRNHNSIFGRILTHINGACYAPYEDVVEHHINHHIDRADLVPFDIAQFFNDLPKPIRYLFVALEWAYFPVFAFIMRWRLIIAPFKNHQKRHLRGRTLAILAYRGSLAVIVAFISVKALLLYFLAYICFINLVRLADAFHHTYEYAIAGEEINRRDRLYEQANTYSNFVSQKYPWLNLLYLNFGYHNAHHHDMRCPWYRLPELHQSLYGDEAKNLLPLPQLISNYHRFRIARLFGGQGDVDAENRETEAFTGGIGVSLLTPP